MPFHFRKRLTIWPFPKVWLNFSDSLIPSSVSVQLWRWTWNSRTRRQSLDLPGPINYRSRGRKR